jgi:hypothetical protein
VRKVLAGAAGVLAALAALGCAAANASAPAVQKAGGSLNGIYKTRVETRALFREARIWRLSLPSLPQASYLHLQAGWAEVDLLQSS